MQALTDPLPPLDPVEQVTAWAESGAMALTGMVDGSPLGPPAALVGRAQLVGDAVADAAARLGASVRVSPLALLGERAAIAGLNRRGRTSVGGASRLLPTADGSWIAASLARPDDVALVPAWLERDLDGDPWVAVERGVAARAAGEVVDRGRLLGLPVAELDEAQRAPRAGVVASRLGRAEPRRSLAGVTVVELASLWAGPLCGSLLQAAGATVTKVESTARPDGARRGPLAFFDLLNAGKRSVLLDLSATSGVGELARLLRSADVVIEGSRPRALEQLGIDAEALVAGGGPRAWVSITGHGRAGDAGLRVAFGDDAAVAGGLVAHAPDGPMFCAGAIADPFTGVVAAGAVLEALAADERVLLDIALASVATAFAGPCLPVPPGLEARAPTARTPHGRGPRLGEHGSG